MKVFSILMLLAFAFFCGGDLVAPDHCDHGQADAAHQDCACVCCHVDPASAWAGPSSPVQVPAAATLAGDDLIPPEELPCAIEHPPQIA